MKTTEVANATGLYPHTIRAAEKRGLITAERDINGRRVFAPAVVDQLKKLYLSDRIPEYDSTESA